MQTVKIKTAQNVDIEYEIASVGSRILAALLDYTILIIFYIGLFYAIDYFNIKLDGDLIVLIVLLPFPFFFYDLVCEILMDGQSFGKMVLKIKVVKMDGSQPTIGSYILRWLLRIIEGIAPFYGAVAIITILINGKGQRIGDIAAGTTVIKLRQRISLEDTILVKLDVNYRPKFIEAERLDEKVITLIKEVLDFNKKNRNTKSAEKILNKTKNTIENKIGKKSELPPDEFLQTILKDYNYFHGKI